MNDERRLRSGELELLLALLEHRRTGAAATALGTDQSTVSRRLAQLEARFGAAFFVRTPRGMVPTPLAERLHPSAASVVASLRLAERLLADAAQGPSGPLRIALPEAFAQWIVAPRLAEFITRFPSITVTLDDGPTLVDLAAGEAHLAIRVVRPRSGDIVTTRWGRGRLIPFGAPAYVEQHPDPPRWLGWDDRYAQFGEAEALMALIGRPPDVKFSRLTTMVAAARAGAGLVLLGERLGPHLGLVQAPVDPLPAFESSLWLAAPRALRSSPAVAAGWEWLIELGREARRVPAQPGTR